MGPSTIAKDGLLARHGDAVLGAAVMGILVALIMPLPTICLDVLLTLNFSYVLLLLMVVLSTERQLNLSTFPTLLLIGTLFRLALNVASTRLILLNADAGKVIQSFGQMVVGGELVVGIVIFFIIIVIQFVVITKGAERISEVAARFTLDAMPGKQMSIDADLNAGLIDEAQARRRRQEIVQEADFYGAMDGASKYVRGDAIAGIIIVLINIIGGLVIGLSKHMPIGEAVKTYSILTVGDGLVSQIPAVIMSTAAGVLVTKSSSEHRLSKELGFQLFANSRAVAMAALVVFGFVLIPGLPELPFVVLGGLLGAAYLAARRRTARDEGEKEAARRQAADKKESDEESVLSLIEPDRLAVEVGYNLIRLIDPRKGGKLLDRVKALRRRFAREMGLILPKIRIVDNVELDINRYVIKLDGQKVAEGEVHPNRLMAMKPDGEPDALQGIETTEPSFGLPVRWIKQQDKESAELSGHTVVGPESVFITHLSETLRSHAHEILNRQDVKQLLETVKKDNPTVVEELVPDILSVGQVQQVLSNLLAEGIPINNLSAILEQCANYGTQIKDPALLTELVRRGLARVISLNFADQDGELRVLYLDPALEQEILEAVQQVEGKESLAMSPARVRQILAGIADQTGEVLQGNSEVVIATDGRIRRHVRDMVQRTVRYCGVISHDEITTDVKVRTVGIIVPREEPVSADSMGETLAAQGAKET